MLQYYVHLFKMYVYQGVNWFIINILNVVVNLHAMLLSDLRQHLSKLLKPLS